MKWIKKNKFTVIAIIVFVLIAILCYKVIQIFFPNERVAYYGDRLEGKVLVDKKIYKDIKTKISENESVKKVVIRENGRRIDISIIVNKDTGRDSARGLVTPISEFFNESQLGYYDIQVLIGKDEKEENDFPIIAYKHHNLSSFSWNKDRNKREVEEDK